MSPYHLESLLCGQRGLKVQLELQFALRVVFFKLQQHIDIIKQKWRGRQF